MQQTTITDVTLREYGQNVSREHLSVFTPELRSDIAHAIMDAGIAALEVLSCVNPRLAPAMEKAQLKPLVRSIGRREGIRIITLVPNRAGYETFRSLDLGPEGFGHTLGVFVSAVEAHNRANLGRSIKDTLKEYKPVLRDALSRRTGVAAYISAAFGYVAPGATEITRADTDEINDLVSLFLDMGVDTVTLSDLQGVANGDDTGLLLEAVLDKRSGPEKSRLGYHPHHLSNARALANSRRAYDIGIRRFDASLGGTGGCITGAPGNQPTEGLVRVLHESGASTGLDEAEIASLARLVGRRIYDRIELRAGETGPS